MRCAALQIEHHFGDVQRALDQVENLLQQAGPLDLALLPEACLTGYVSPSGNFDLSPQAEPIDGPTASALTIIAQKFHTTLVGPIIERSGDKIYNSSIVISPTGARIAHYRKRHPWLPERWATAGTLPYPYFEVAGHRCLLAICYDIHFLEEEIPQFLEGADLLLFPSAWVDGDPYEDTRTPLLTGIAKRQKISILNANWAQSWPRIPGQGGSRILGPTGQLLALLLDKIPGIVVAEIP